VPAGHATVGADDQPVVVHSAKPLQLGLGLLPYSHSRPTSGQAPPVGSDAGHATLDPPLLEPLPELLPEPPLLEPELPPLELLEPSPPLLELEPELLPEPPLEPLDPELLPDPPLEPEPPELPLDPDDPPLEDPLPSAPPSPRATNVLPPQAHITAAAPAIQSLLRIPSANANAVPATKPPCFRAVWSPARGGAPTSTSWSCARLR
jgi:hypothetical protein